MGVQLSKMGNSLQIYDMNVINSGYYPIKIIAYNDGKYNDRD